MNAENRLIYLKAYDTNSERIFNSLKKSFDIKPNYKYFARPQKCFAKNAFRNNNSVWFVPYSSLNNLQDKNKCWFNKFINGGETVREHYFKNGLNDFFVDKEEFGKTKRLIFAKEHANSKYVFYGVYEIKEIIEKPDIGEKAIIYFRCSKNFPESK